MIGTGTTVQFGIVERFPAPVEERTGRRVYPPMQWWPLRVMNPWHKAGFLLAFVVLARGFTGLAGSVVPFETVHIVWSVLSAVLIVVLARSFRGIDEPVEPPRAWWRLTAYPKAGWWLGALHLLAVAAPLTGTWRPGDIVDVVSSAGLGVAFLNSSIRLTALRRRS